MFEYGSKGRGEENDGVVGYKQDHVVYFRMRNSGVVCHQGI